jgi:hypothetical protein
MNLLERLLRPPLSEADAVEDRYEAFQALRLQQIEIAFLRQTIADVRAERARLLKRLAQFHERSTNVQPR